MIGCPKAPNTRLGWRKNRTNSRWASVSTAGQAGDAACFKEVVAFVIVLRGELVADKREFCGWALIGRN
jgi:hypothetical protein